MSLFLFLQEAVKCSGLEHKVWIRETWVQFLALPLKNLIPLNLGLPTVKEKL